MRTATIDMVNKPANISDIEADAWLPAPIAPRSALLLGIESPTQAPSQRQGDQDHGRDQ